MNTFPKYAQVAASLRTQIAEGKLRPGESAPSGAALARATGYSTLTCRKALHVLIKEGTLVPGTSRNARPRVSGTRGTSDEATLTTAARDLSLALAARRHAEDFTQPELAALIGVSVTTIGHAETGRLWQSRRFWERADKALTASGELLRLHDAYRAAVVSPGFAAEADNPVITAGAADIVACVTVTWGDGTVTTVHPPVLSESQTGTRGRPGTSRDGTSRP